MLAKMVDMAKTPEEVANDLSDMPVAMPGNRIAGPKYPYGLTISLDDETLEKLGLDGDLPSVGEIVHFEAIAKVTSASMHETEVDGATKQCCRVELQITNMGVAGMDPADEQEERSEARRQRFYGGSMAEDADDDGE